MKKNKGMSQHICTSLLAVLLLVSTISCGKNTQNAPETLKQGRETETTEPETENTETRPTLPERDYEGADFTYLQYDISEQGITYLVNDLCPTGENGDTLNDAIWKRNTVVEDMYNVRFAEVVNTNVVAVLDQMLQAGDITYDAVNPDLLRLRSLTLNGLLMNLYALPIIDFSNPWWDALSVESLTVLGKLPAVFSDITLVDKYSTYVTLFHKGMAQDYGLPDLYRLTSDGKWTLDQMIALSEVVSQDKNGDGVMDKYDIYGISAQNDAMYVLMHGCGAHFADTDESGYPTDVFFQERTVAAVQKIAALMTDTQHFFNRQNAGLSMPECVDMFAANQALFFLRPLYTVEMLRDMENDYGVIPIPKYAETDERYQCTLNKWVACATAVPLVVSDAERTGIILEALSAESHFMVLPSFYEDVLGAKIVRDVESAVMLDLVFDSRMYDIGYIYNFGSFCDKLMNLSTGKGQNVASLYESNKSAITTGIDEFIEKVN